MFALLSYFALADDGNAIESKNEYNTDAAFNLGYYSVANDKTYSMSYKDAGFYVAVRMNDKISLLYEGVDVNGLTLGGVQVSADLDHGSNSNYVILPLNNYGTKPVTFDLGVFADSSFGDDDNAVVTMRDDKRGFYIVNKDDSSMKATFVLKGLPGIRDVDTIYIGTDTNAENRNALYYPYFNTSNVIKSTGDSVFAFSWLQITIEPDQYEELQFLVTPDDKIDLPPITIDLTEQSESGYTPGKNIPLTFNVTNYEPDQSVTFVLKVDGAEVIKESFTSTKENNYSKVFTYNANLGAKDSLSYEAYAYDNEGGVSFNHISRTLYKSRDPTLKLTKTPPTQLERGSTIVIEGTVNDEDKVNLYYQIDSYEETLLPPAIPSYNTDKFFTKTITLPLDLPLGPHTLKIFAKDNHDLKTYANPGQFKITIVPPPNPVVYSAYASDRRVSRGEEVVIYGVSSDPNVGQTVSISVIFQKTDPIFIGNLTVEDPTLPFAFFYTIPNITSAVGNKYVDVIATDETGLNSSKTAKSYKTRIYFDIIDPNNPPKPKPLGNFTDTTYYEGESQNTIDISYKECDKCSILGITYNDIGIFSAFRVYDTNNYQPGKQMLISHNKTAKIGKLTVKAYPKYEDVTGYFQLLWDITNEGYLPQYIDLGAFYDSYLSDADNNTIVPREDGRGINVYDFDDKNGDLSYTIFMRDYGSLPSVDYTYFHPVPKDKETGEIRIEDMPFFESSDKYPSGDAMIAFSWAGRRIPGGETVTLGVTFAAADNVKTPTRIVDHTYIYDDYAFLHLDIIDGDVGEKVNLKVTINDTIVITNEEISITSQPYKYYYKFDFAPGSKYFRYVVEAVDTDKRFVSNIINVTHPITNPPFLILDQSTLHENKKYFFGWEPIHLSGYFTDVDFDPVDIKYSIDGGRPIHIRRFQRKQDEDFGYFDYNISSFPPEIKEGIHFIKVWAEDINGISSGQDEYGNSFDFTLAYPVFPRIRNAGFNTKKAKIGSNIIAFSFIDGELSLGKFVKTEFKIDDGEWIPSNWISAVKDTKPSAWYQYVDEQFFKKGMHTITFRVVDQDGLPSQNTITRKLEIE